jgi:hypothetical protein
MAQTAKAHFADLLKKDGRFIPAANQTHAVSVLFREWGRCKACEGEGRSLFSRYLLSGDLIEDTIKDVHGYRTLTAAERVERKQANDQLATDRANHRADERRRSRRRPRRTKVILHPAVYATLVPESLLGYPVRLQPHIVAVGIPPQESLALVNVS